MIQTDYLGLWYRQLNDSFALADFWPERYYSDIEIINEFIPNDFPDSHELHQMARQIRG